jgi:hypothetical protein
VNPPDDVLASKTVEIVRADQLDLVMPIWIKGIRGLELAAVVRAVNRDTDENKVAGFDETATRWTTVVNRHLAEMIKPGTVPFKPLTARTKPGTE